VQNATWNVSSGKPVIVPSKPGFGVTDRALASAIESVYTLPEGQRTAEVEFGVIKPSFSTSAAEKAGVTELLASYTQRFPYAPYRVTNIGRAAKYIDGTYLAPGAEYSMNGTIKERTYENGYTDGWIIGGGGVFKMEPGGGVSTATTAMFNGAFFSGMQFLEWRAHSIWIPDRYVAGREATVFWGSLDMRFKNPAPTGVFITTYMSNTSVTVKFWGTKQWEKIESVSGEKRNISQSRVIENDQPDCHEQNAVIGFRITVERVFYKDGAEVKREPFNTTYRAAPEVKCTYKAPPTKKPTPKPTKTTKKPTVTPSPSTSATP
jgi:vancomycin resistance protein YoaR